MGTVQSHGSHLPSRVVGNVWGKGCTCRRSNKASLNNVLPLPHSRFICSVVQNQPAGNNRLWGRAGKKNQCWESIQTTVMVPFPPSFSFQVQGNWGKGTYRHRRSAYRKERGLGSKVGSWGKREVRRYKSGMWYKAQ